VRARIRTGLVKLRDATTGAAVVRAAHPGAEGSVDAYVLGTLDADERRAFEAHLAGCADCAAEAESLRPVADALASAVPQRTPRPELRARVLGALAEDAPPPPARGADRMPRFDVRRWLPAGLLLGARRRRVRPGPDVGRRPGSESE
jgi:anti-sigma factor RsiW